MARNRVWQRDVSDFFWSSSDTDPKFWNISSLPAGVTAGHSFIQMQWLNEWVEHAGGLNTRRLSWALYVGEGGATNIFPPGGGTQTLASGDRWDQEPMTVDPAGPNVRGTLQQIKEETSGQHMSRVNGHGLWFAARVLHEGPPNVTPSMLHFYIASLVFS